MVVLWKSVCRDVVQEKQHSPARQTAPIIQTRQKFSFNPKYEYPEDLPPYQPKERIQDKTQTKRPVKKSFLEGSDSSPASHTETESEMADDEFLGQFTSNHEFLCTNNQIKQSMCEGNA